MLANTAPVILSASLLKFPRGVCEILCIIESTSFKQNRNDLGKFPSKRSKDILSFSVIVVPIEVRYVALALHDFNTVGQGETDRDFFSYREGMSTIRVVLSALSKYFPN